jgi:hypothetical protein
MLQECIRLNDDDRAGLPKIPGNNCRDYLSANPGHANGKSRSTMWSHEASGTSSFAANVD